MATSILYSYDSLGRLINATFNDGSVANFEYDKLGNRTVTFEGPCSCAPKFILVNKSGNFTADGGTGTYYRVSATATITLPPSPADGSVLKFKVTGGTSTFAFYSTETFNHANGVSDQQLVMTSGTGVLELIAVTGGWDET